MPSRTLKWTHDLRLALYSRLTSEFGPYKTWGKVAYPDGKQKELEEVLKELAAYFQSLTGDSFKWTAVQQQMKWGLTAQGPVKRNQVREYVLNKAAALDTGFLSSSELKGLIHTT